MTVIKEGPLIRLMGTVRERWSTKVLLIPTHLANERLKTVLLHFSEHLKEKFWEFFDDDLTPKRSVILIVNGVDYVAFGGLDARIAPETEITILSALHGGKS